MICVFCHPLVDARCEYVNGIDIITAIQVHMEQLAVDEELERLGIKVKENYVNVFIPIPHVNEMPSKVVCKIKLKDTSKAITTRSYSCLHKSCKAWGILIQQHLDAGHIRPSSSARASSAFLMPKADTTNLPH